MEGQGGTYRSRITALNQTPEGMHASSLLGSLKGPHRLATAVLLEWAVDNLAADPVWAEAVSQALVLAEDREPELMQRTIVPAAFLQARTRTEAGKMMLRWVADLIPPGTSPA